MNVTVPVEAVEQLFRQRHKVRTIEDLWSIPIDVSESKPIRLINDPYQPTWTVEQMDWTKTWTIYSYLRAQHVNASVWIPDFKTWLDRFRFKLHLKLIQWKVVI